MGSEQFTGQAVPTARHERALFKVLRFAKSKLHLFQRFRCEVEPIQKGSVLFTDAWWGTPSVPKAKTSIDQLVSMAQGKLQ